MLLFWLLSPRRSDAAPMVMAVYFLFHYFQRSFVFPFRIKGKSRMPLAIVVMGILFNLINAYMIGGWLFYVAPEGMYKVSWLWSPLFIIGSAVFFTGMAINWHSDHIIRNLRKPVTLAITYLAEVFTVMLHLRTISGSSSNGAVMPYSPESGRSGVCGLDLRQSGSACPQAP